MVPLPMTLIDLWPWFQGRDVFRHISETTWDRAIVTVEHQQEVIGSLSNGDIFNDLCGPLTRYSRLRHFWSWISQKRCVLRTKLLQDTNWNHRPTYHTEWHHVWWPWVTCKRAARFVSDSWVACWYCDIKYLHIPLAFWYFRNSYSSFVLISRNRILSSIAHLGICTRMLLAISLLNEYYVMSCHVLTLLIGWQDGQPARNRKTRNCLPCIKDSRPISAIGPILWIWVIRGWWS